MDEVIDYKRWGPSEPKAVFLLVHGLGAHTGRWEAVGDFFADNGIASYAVELNSMKNEETFRSYYNKILKLYNIIVKENPAKKIFLVGESMGALISFLLAAGSPGLFSGLVCISPAFVNRYKPGILDRIRMLTALFLNPKKVFKIPFDSSMCTRDIEYRKTMDQDPREYRAISSKLILDILLAQVRAKTVRNKITVPVLFLLAGEDKLVDPQAAKSIFDSLEVKDKALVEFPGMYHSLSIEMGKEEVFGEMLKWVNKRI